MKDLLIMFCILVAWFVLNRYILPRMGIST